MRRRIFAGIASAVFAIVLAQLAMVQPASAAPSGDWLKNAGSNLCLDASVSQGVRMNTCSTTSPYQRWQRWFNASGQYFLLKNAADDTLCLDGSISSGARLLPCTENVWQVWASASAPYLTNTAYGWARALDGSASQGVRMNEYSSTSRYQTWRLVAV